MGNKQEMIEEEDGKKPRHRSPNYPMVGLREAVDRLRRFYEKDGKAGAPPKIAATHIGFTKPHGQAMSVISALKKFGLIEEGQNGRLVPSQRGIEILNLSEGDPRRTKALAEAATSPDAYVDLIGEYRQTGLPANETLESELVTYKKFNPKSVTAFVRDFKDSLEFAGITDIGALSSGQEIDSQMQSTKTDEEPKTLGKAIVRELERGATVGQALTKIGEKWGAPLLLQTLVISIPRNFKVEIGVRGDELKREDLAKIKSQFNRWIEGLEEAFED